jgi:hypothetical protein
MPELVTSGAPQGTDKPPIIVEWAQVYEGAANTAFAFSAGRKKDGRTTHYIDAYTLVVKGSAVATAIEVTINANESVTKWADYIPAGSVPGDHWGVAGFTRPLQLDAGTVPIINVGAGGAGCIILLSVQGHSVTVRQ